MMALESGQLMQHEASRAGENSSEETSGISLSKTRSLSSNSSLLINPLGKSSNSSNETVIARVAPQVSGQEANASPRQESTNTHSEQCNGFSQPPTNHSSPGIGQANARKSRLKSFLMFTSHLNPFSSHHHHQSAAVTKRRSSLEDEGRETPAVVESRASGEQQQKRGSYLSLFQRYFGRNSGGDLFVKQQQNEDCLEVASKSAPVTPIKWRQLDHSATPNGFGQVTEAPAVQQQQQSLKLQQKPSVRFVEGGSGGGVRADQSIQAGARISEEEDDLEQQGMSIVSRLFKVPAADGRQVPLELQPGECPMNSSKFRAYGYRLIDYISNYLDTIDERRVSPLNIEPGYLKSLIQPSAPEQGDSFANIMHDFESHIMCGITHWQHPHFHAYFPAGNAYPSILADMLSDAIGGNGFSWAASPAYTELEIIMLDWMGQMIGLPDEFLCLSSRSQDSKGGGVIQGSASECVLVNLLAARHWAIDKLRRKYPGQADGLLLSKLIGYCSKEAHSCVEKAAMIGFIRMRALETDEKHSLRGETLIKAMEQDKAQGLEPFIVCATLGTTSCCSFDRLDELGEVCQREDVWLHVDAAYAGSALICPEFRYLMKGIELASSFNTNPNKWLLINFDCSLMWVKDRFKLTRAFVVDPLYLQHSFSDQAIDYRHWGIPLSRRFRALKLWFTIRNYGVDGLRQYIRNHVRLAKLFEQCIRKDSRFSITNEVVLGLVCFRLIGSNALNQRLLSMINASGKLHMVPASLNGRYVIRFCVCDQFAKEDDIRYAYEQISQFATELFDSIRAGKERIRAISQQNTIDVSSISLHRQQSASADSSRQAQMGELDQRQLIQQLQQEQQDQQQQVAAQRLSRKNSRCNSQILPDDTQSTNATSARSSPAKSPLVKQVSVQPQQQCGSAAAQTAADFQPVDEDLEQEIVLDSLATFDGYDYELDDDDLLEQPYSESAELPSPPGANQPPAAADQAVAGEADQAKLPGGRARRWRAPGSRNGHQSATIAAEQDEAEDEVFTLAERRQRMSLRYKREFFVRVVSDPRVYRASISGDINAHSSCCSLGGGAGSAGANGSIQSANSNSTGQSSGEVAALTNGIQPAKAQVSQPQVQVAESQFVRG